MSAKMVKVEKVKGKDVKDVKGKGEAEKAEKAKRGPMTEEQKQTLAERNEAARLQFQAELRLLRTGTACRLKRAELRALAKVFHGKIAKARDAYQNARNVAAFLQENLHELRDSSKTNTTHKQALSAHVLFLKENRAQNRQRRKVAAAAAAAAGGGAAADDDNMSSSSSDSDSSDDEEDAVTTEGEAEAEAEADF
jgi:hypothetical protein